MQPECSQHLLHSGAAPGQLDHPCPAVSLAVMLAPTSLSHYNWSCSGSDGIYTTLNQVHMSMNLKLCKHPRHPGDCHLQACLATNTSAQARGTLGTTASC